jgi:hypothetical protein
MDRTLTRSNGDAGTVIFSGPVYQPGPGIITIAAGVVALGLAFYFR